MPKKTVQIDPVDQLKPNVKSMVRAEMSSLSRIQRAAIKTVLDWGEALDSLQRVLIEQGASGSFNSIVEYHYCSRSSARNYINAWRCFSGADARLIEDRAMYLLSSDDSLQPAVEEAKTIMQEGERVSYGRALDLKRSCLDNGEPDEDIELPEGLSEGAQEVIRENRIEATPEQLAALAEYEDEYQELLLESTVDGRQTLEQAVISGEIPDKPIEDRISEENAELESFCRQITKLAKQIPDLAWVKKHKYDATARSQVNAACKSLRLAKLHAPCPRCDGAGCEVCLDVGALPKNEYQQLPKQ